MGTIIKCQCGFENVVENNQHIEKCRACRNFLVMKSTKEVQSLSLVQRIKQQKNLEIALAKNVDISQENKDLVVSSIGLIALSSKSYIIAQQHFKKIIEQNPDNSEAYYYYSLSLLNGKRPFVNNRCLIDELLQNLDFALALDIKGKYYYLKALLIFDFYVGKSIRFRDDYRSFLELADAFETTDDEKEEIFEILNMKRPMGF